MSESVRWRLLFLLVVVGLSGYRALVIWGSDLQLFYDQAYYYYWSLHPGWGYYSKPPMVAWLVFLTTSLWGSSELAISAGGIILYALTSLLVYAIGYSLYDERTGIWSGLSFICMPLVGFNSLFMSTDAPLMFFWALTILLFLWALRSGRWPWWLATGLAAGLGMLSKYNMGILAVGMLLYLVAVREHRRWLLDMRLWAGIAVAALVLAPNIVWNMQHDFISFRHTAEISQLDRTLVHPDRLLEFLLGQFGVFGPVLMAVFFWYAFRPSSYRDDAHRLMLFPAVTVLGVISAQALLARAHLNWAAPAFVTAPVFVSAVLLDRQRPNWLAWAAAINLALLSILYHYHPIADMFGVELKRGRTPYYRVLGWRELGAEVSKVAADYPDAWLLSDSRKYLAYLSYYAVPRHSRVAWWGPTGGIPNNHYQLVADISAVGSHDFIYAGDRRLRQDELASFSDYRYLGERHVQPLPDLTISVHLYLLRDFRGYRR